MLVEINLLPKKEPKNVTSSVIISSALFIALVAGGIILWQGSHLNDEITTLENEITTTNALIEAEEAKQANNQAAGSYAELGSAVRWANEEPLKSVPIISHIVALLPQRGFIQQITYAEAGAVNLTVQFDTSRDSAYFLKRLLDSEWISEATLTSLSADKAIIEGEDEDAKKKLSETILPRYTAEYQLMLNRTYINQVERQKAIENSEQGGDGL